MSRDEINDQSSLDWMNEPTAMPEDHEDHYAHKARLLESS